HPAPARGARRGAAAGIARRVCRRGFRQEWQPRWSRRSGTGRMTGNIASVVLISLGLVFFVAGTLGLLRFPDVHSRLHALTKADNLGLGFIVSGAAVQAGGLAL